jgi:hypothetical protein
MIAPVRMHTPHDRLGSLADVEGVGATSVLSPKADTVRWSSGAKKQASAAYARYATISRTTPPTMTATAATICGPMCSCLRNTKLSKRVTRG